MARATRPARERGCLTKALPFNLLRSLAPGSSGCLAQHPCRITDGFNHQVWRVPLLPSLLAPLLADRGVQVSLFDKDWPPRGASWAAAGMLAPAYEAAAVPEVHPNLYALCQASAALWPDWATKLEQRSGLSAGYMPGPTIALAQTPEQAEHLAAMRHALAGQAAAPTECLSDLPILDPSIMGHLTTALLLPGDGQADNRKTLAALIKIAEAHSRVTICPEAAALTKAGGPPGHDVTLVCAGWQTQALLSQEAGLNEIVPYGGQMLSVARVEDAPRITIRCGDLYIVPKDDRIVIGATTEPGRVLDAAESDIVAELKLRAAKICPVLAGAPVIETWAGVRPGTKDHAPILGETKIPGLFVASGHYRNGILLAPLTAQIMADLIVDGTKTDLARAFAPRARLAAPV